MRRGRHRPGEISPECRQLPDRIPGRDRLDGISAGAAHGGTLPGFKQVDSGAGDL